jgi:flagellar assembly protein FliH
LLHERRREAEQLLAEAQAQAASLLAEAQERAQAAEAEARERGFRSGLEAAREAQRLLLADLEALRAEARAERERFFADLEPEVVRLALAIAEKIIRQEVDLHPEIVVGVARAALNELKEAQSVRVAAHPADVDLLRQHLQPMPGGLTEVTVHPDPQVTRGGCRVDSDRGSADACLERQLERAAAAIQGGEL